MTDEIKIHCISTQRTVLLKAGKKSYRAKFYGNDAASATLEFYSRPNACWHFLDETGVTGKRVINALLKQLAKDPTLLANISPSHLQTDYYNAHKFSYGEKVWFISKFGNRVTGIYKSPDVVDGVHGHLVTSEDAFGQPGGESVVCFVAGNNSLHKWEHNQ